MATINIVKPTAAGTISGNQFRVQTFDIATATWGGDTITAAGPLVCNGGDVAAQVPSGGDQGKAGLAIYPAPGTPGKRYLGFFIHSVVQGTSWSFDPTVTASHPQGVYGGTYGGTFMGLSNLLRSMEGVGAHLATSDPDNLYEVNYTSAVLAFSIIGAYKKFVQDSTTKFPVIQDGASTDEFLVVGFRGGPNLGVIGDTNPRVLVRWLTGASPLTFV